MTEAGDPDVSFLPAMFRRRLSRLSRMAFRAAHECVEDAETVVSVFCSRHGELRKTSELLARMTGGEPMSPTAFSTSVHNTAAGLYSIATGNTYESTSAAAGQDTFEAAFVLSVSSLNRHDKLLLVSADEPLPGMYEEFADMPEYSYGAAFLIGSEDSPAEGPRIRLSFDPLQPCEANKVEPGTLSFLRLLNSPSQREISVPGTSFYWNWKKDVD